MFKNLKKLARKNFFAHLKKCFTFLHLFFLIGCSQPKSNKSLEQLFLENVMIREKGLYVLMGSKPLSCFEVKDIYSMSTAKFAYQQYQKENPNSQISFEEFQKQRKSSLPQLPLRLCFEKLWNHWNEKINSSISPCYQFVSRKSPFNPEVNFGLFINVPSTTYVLKKNYDSFSEITGISFDPFTILNEISNNDSLFWERVFHSHYLMGLLFGFGERNAFFFDWGAQHNAFPPDQQRLELSDKRFVDENKTNVSCADLKLPLFGSFTIEDPCLEKYKNERNYILQQFKGKDFMTVVMQWLMPIQDPH